MGEDRAPEPGSFRARWGARLTALVGPRDRKKIAERIGVKPDFFNKCLRGERTLSYERWEPLAVELGLGDFREIFPTPQKSS